MRTHSIPSTVSYRTVRPLCTSGRAATPVDHNGHRRHTHTPPPTQTQPRLGVGPASTPRHTRTRTHAHSPGRETKVRLSGTRESGKQTDRRAEQAATGTHRQAPGGRALCVNFHSVVPTRGAPSARTPGTSTEAQDDFFHRVRRARARCGVCLG